MWQSFEQEFSQDKADILICSSEVKEEISLAKAQAVYEDQQAQVLERKAASKHRSELSSLFSRTKNTLGGISEQQEHARRRLVRESIIFMPAQNDIVLTYQSTTQTETA